MERSILGPKGPKDSISHQIWPPRRNKAPMLSREGRCRLGFSSSRTLPDSKSRTPTKSYQINRGTGVQPQPLIAPERCAGQKRVPGTNQNSSERNQPVIVKRIRENKNRPRFPPARTPGLSCEQCSHYQSDLRMVES